MKNYYEILEVDKNASQEVIEKAYRTLAKKYHPDLQQGQKQEEYAEKMKIINQAYDVLSDDAKRQEYNQKIENETISREQHERIMQENYELKQQINQQTHQQRYQQVQQMDEGTILNMSRVLSEQMKAARKQAYYDAYIQDMKNRGYKIKYKHDLKYYLKLIKVVAITILIGFLIYQIPFVKEFFTDLYNENAIFKAIIDVFKNTFSATF